MYFTIAQRPLYNSLASANSEAEISSLDCLQAHAAFSLCGFFVRVAVSFMGGLRVEPKGSPIPCNVGTANARSLPSKLAVWSAGSQNLLQETAMLPTYNLTHAVRQYMRGTLSEPDAQWLAFDLCLNVKEILTVLSDAISKENRLSTNSDIASALETCAALIEFAQEIQPKGV